MAYYRNYRHQYWYNSLAKYDQLTSLFGEAVEEIKLIFLGMHGTKLNAMLEKYGNIYGSSAENYARNTFEKWKNGTTKMSGQTMERLIELIPPYLTPDQRYGLLRKVLDRQKYNKTPHYIHININPKDPIEGFAKIDEALLSLRKQDSLAYLPKEVMQAASWLYDDDITVARAMIAEAANIENNLLLSSAEREIELLKKTIFANKKTSANYSLAVPTGNLTISVRDPSSCFIATTCFGVDSYEVKILRMWRDNELQKRKMGRKFISWYYDNGIFISQIVSSCNILKIITVACLRLLVKLIKLCSLEVINERK